MATRRIDDAAGLSALDAWLAGGRERMTVATAVRWTLQALAERFPGSSVEVRVPPFGAVQCVEGPRHTRGTPPNVVELAPEVWLGLAIGRLGWDEELEGGRVLASGTRADLAPLLPVIRRG